MLLRTLCIALIALGCSADSSFGFGTHLSRKFGSAKFSSATWKEGGKEARGKMVASLMHSYFRDLTTEERITRMLGPSECRGDEEGDLCYLFTSKDTSYELDFPINHSTHPGRAEGAMIGEADRRVRSITVRSVPVPANTR